MNNHHSEFFNQPVFIAGGAEGIGAALAKGFYDRGAKVVILDKNKQRAEITANALELEIGKTAPLVIGADLSNEAERQSALAQAIAAVGAPVSFISTIGFDQRLDFAEMSQEALENSLRINFVAPFYTAKELLPIMRQNGGGTMCLFTSPHAEQNLTDPDLTGYSTAKAALNKGLNHLAIHAGKGNTSDHIIRIFGFCPGWVKTEKQTERFADAQFEADSLHYTVPQVILPEDNVETVIFLLSQQSKFFSNRIFYYDRGPGV